MSFLSVTTNRFVHMLHVPQRTRRCRRAGDARRNHRRGHLERRASRHRSVSVCTIRTNIGYCTTRSLFSNCSTAMMIHWQTCVRTMTMRPTTLMISATTRTTTTTKTRYALLPTSIRGNIYVTAFCKTRDKGVAGRAGACRRRRSAVRGLLLLDTHGLLLVLLRRGLLRVSGDLRRVSSACAFY